jgi:hypothetical protein
VVSLRWRSRAEVVTSRSCGFGLIRESRMRKDEFPDKRAAREKFETWLREIEAAAADLVEVGDALFQAGEPSDPLLLRRYRLFNRVKAAVALPPGPERVVALQAAKIDRKH